jgi:hypothetical protein
LRVGGFRVRSQQSTFNLTVKTETHLLQRRVKQIENLLKIEM